MVSGSFASTSIGKPKSDGRFPLTFCHESPASSLRITCQCFCMKSVSGLDGFIATWWTQCPTSRSSSGSSRERRPLLIGVHVSPPSSVRKAPAAEMATTIRFGSSGLIRIVCKQSPPAPGCPFSPLGCSRRPERSFQVWPASADLKSGASSTSAQTVSGSASEGSRCQTRANSHGCWVPSYHWCVPGTPSYANSFPTVSQFLPPSSERCMTWPCQPVDCDAYRRSGSAGEPFKWYISQPMKSGPWTSQSSRVPSAVMTNAPLRVPTRSRTLLIDPSLSVRSAQFKQGLPGPHGERCRSGLRSATGNRVRAERSVAGSNPALSVVRARATGPFHTGVVKVGRHEVAVTNPNKVFFPEAGLTKGDLVSYYLDVAPCALHHIRRRPFHMKRYPNGVDGDFFHQKRVPPHPDFVDEQFVQFPSGHSTVFAVVDNPAALAWVINLGCIELHTWHSRVEEIERPDYLLIDLDPSEGNPWEFVREIAVVVKEVIDGLGLASYPKTSGATGLHVLSPIRPELAFPEVRRFAKALAEEVERRIDDQEVATTTWRVADRRGVFVDFGQNARDRTIACAYSVRPTPDARVSAPMSWKEVARSDPSRFTVKTMRKRIDKVGDLTGGMWRRKASLLPRFEQLGIPPGDPSISPQRRASGRSGRWSGAGA